MSSPIRPRVKPPTPTDPESRRNFENLNDFLGNNPLFGFTFLEFETDRAVDNLKIAHGLSYTPRDIIKLKILGASVTFNHAAFDPTFLDVSTSGAARVRCLVGTYNRGSGRTDALEGPEEIEAALPVGAVILFPRNSVIPDGWLLIESKAYLKSEYPNLYAVVGDEFANADDNSSQFRLPTVTNGTLNHIIKYR